jgi:Tfp pilus assembly protein PilO
MTLWQRLLAEKRALIMPLAIGAILNAAVYGFWVYPLGVKSATASDRAAAAAEARRAAERDHEAARKLVVGKSRADEELATFFDKVLPPDVPSARNLTFTLLPSLAKKTNIKFLTRSQLDDKVTRETRFGRLHTRISLTGDYESFRQFLYELETAPDFIILDNISLAQNDPTKPLAFNIELSTYYRLGANGN